MDNVQRQDIKAAMRLLPEIRMCYVNNLLMKINLFHFIILIRTGDIEFSSSFL